MLTVPMKVKSLLSFIILSSWKRLPLADLKIIGHIDVYAYWKIDVIPSTLKNDRGNYKHISGRTYSDRGSRFLCKSDCFCWICVALNKGPGAMFCMAIA